MWTFVSRALYALLFLACTLLGGHWALQRLSGDSGLAEVADDELAVLLNRWNGSAMEVDSPGTEVFLPFVESVHVLKRSPTPLVLSGNRPAGTQGSPELRLRTSDGSLVHFGTVTLRVSLLPGQAGKALRERRDPARPDLKLVEAHLRSIAHDEFGRFTAEELLQGENQAEARKRTRERLELALASRGLGVELSMPDLRFDATYEKSLDDRRVAYQEVERLKAEFLQLEAERAQRLAALEKLKLIELNDVKLQIREYLAKIETTGRAKRAAALQYQENRRAEAQNRKYRLEGEAASLAEAIALRSENFRQEVEPLATAGSALAREAWIDGLKETPLRLQPAPDRDPKANAPSSSSRSL